MNSPGYQLFARSGFTGDKNFRFGRGHGINLIENPADSRTLSNHLVLFVELAEQMFPFYRPVAAVYGVLQSYQKPVQIRPLLKKIERAFFYGFYGDR